MVAMGQVCKKNITLYSIGMVYTINFLHIIYIRLKSELPEPKCIEYFMFVEVVSEFGIWGN